MALREDFLDVLQDYRNQKSYYAGGTLCLDLPEGTFCFNLNGKVSNFSTAASRTMTQEEIELVFETYMNHKGPTNYYKQHLPILQAAQAKRRNS